MNNKPQRLSAGSDAARGFSIIELLVAVIIIGILVAIIVPRLSDRAEEAKRARVNQDLELIQKAQEQVLIDTSYFVRLYVLDDVRGDDGTPNAFPNNDADLVDGFAEEDTNAAYGNNERVFIDSRHQVLPTTERILDGTLASRVFERLVINETFYGWRGPYLTYQVDRNNGQPSAAGNARTYIGDDAWGNDYLLFTPEGLVNDFYQFDPATGTALIGNGLIANTITIKSVNYDCSVFDRFVVLSLGPNGLPGDGSGVAGRGFGTGDDLFRKF
jgi:general secretion pathway protein G